MSKRIAALGITAGLFGGGAAPWTPASISGLAVWLKADAGTFQDTGKTSAATADGNPVMVWADQSGNSRDFVSGGDAYRPLLKLNIINGYPVLRGDGANDYMNYASNNIALPYTLFVVTATTTNQSSLIFEGFSGTGSLRPSLYLANSTGWKWVVVHAAVGHYDLTPITDANFHIHTCVFSDTGVHRIDGTQVNTGDYNFSDETVTKLSLFGRSLILNYGGDIAEVLIYSGAMSSPNISLVESYLTTKYFP